VGGIVLGVPVLVGFRFILVVALTAAMASIAVPQAADAAGGDVHHVGTGGVDQAQCAGGTEQSPWRTIQNSMRCLRAGDVLYVHGGVYEERVHNQYGVDPGTADKPVLVAAFPGEQPVIRGYLRITEPDHWTIVGIDIVGDGDAYGGGDYLLKIRGGTDWTWAHSELHDVRAKAAMRAVPAEERPTPAPRSWRFVRNCVHDTFATTASGVEDHNLYIATGGAGPGLIEGNVLFNALSGENIKLGDDFDGANNLTIRFNTLHNAAQNMLIFGESKNNRIERNIMGPVGGRAKSWYPNVRGFNLAGRGNIAVDNIGFGADRFLFTGNDSGSSAAIADGGNTAFKDPKFATTGRCDGYVPTASGTHGYGARALLGSSYAGVPLLGDWDGNGTDTPGWYDDGRVTLRNDSSVGHADIRFFYGRAGDIPIVGDWNGDGSDTLGIVRAGGEWHLIDSHRGGSAKHEFTYGRVGARGDDLPAVGDWNGDGLDTIGIIRDGAWHLRNSLSGGPGEIRFTYGRIGPRGDDLPLVGDWNGDGLDTIGIVRDGAWHLRNSLSGGAGEISFTYGRVTRGDIPLVGDYDGGGTDTAAIVRDSVTWLLKDQNAGGNADRSFVYAGS
jgi:hypothetical protein